MKRLLVVQCALCAFLLIASLILCFRASQRSAAAGAFGKVQNQNDTFRDLANIIYGDLFYE